MKLARAIAHIHERRSDSFRGCKCPMEADESEHTYLCNKLTNEIEDIFLNHKFIEKICFRVCKSGKFETGEGTCAPVCMDQLGDPRKRGCSHAYVVHHKFVEFILDEGK